SANFSRAISLTSRLEHSASHRTGRISKEKSFMKIIRATIYSSALLVALGAYAQDPGRPTAPSQSPQQTSPQTQPPSQQTQPQAPKGQTQPPQGQPPSIDDQVKALTAELNLDANQQTQVKSILEDQRTQAMTVVNDTAMPREDKVQKIRGIRENTISKVRALLNDDQKKKLDQMLQEPSEAPHPKAPEAP